MVIHSNENRYLLNQRFNLGGTRAPESIEVAGVTLRPGSIVKVEGEVFSGGGIPGHYILTQIKSLDLMMDLGLACDSAKEASPALHLRLWFDAQEEAGGAFKIRVQEFADSAIYQVAYVDRAVFTAKADALVFGGENSAFNIELSTVGQATFKGLKSVPAVLKMTGKGNAVSQSQDQNWVVPMTCSPVKFSHQHLH
jgi:hypothetical protein